MKLSFLMPFGFAALLLGCGGSGSSVNIGPNANSLQYAAPITYSLPPLGYATDPGLFSGNGHAVATGNNSAGVTQIVFWSNPSSFELIKTFGFHATPNAINVHDQIVGSVELSDGDRVHAFFYDKATDTVTMLKETSDTVASAAVSINDNGEIIGGLSLTQGPKYVYWANKDATPVVIDGGPIWILQHIDNSGGIVAASLGTSPYLYWRNHSSTPVPLSGPSPYSVLAVNSYSPNGLIGGAYGPDVKFPIAAFWSHGSAIGQPMSPVVGYAFATVTSCTDSGFATGFFPNKFGTNSAFIYAGGAAIDLKNVTPVQDGWDFVKGIFVDDAGNVTLQGWKNGNFAQIYLQRVK